MLIFRNKDVLLLWLGQVLSQAGTRMYQIALAWWIVTAAGGSGFELGIFMVLGALPPLLLVKKVGRTVDSSRSKRVLVGADLISAAMALGVAAALAAGVLGFAWACAAGFILAASQSFFDPAINKAMAEAAEPKDIEEAVAFQSSTQSLASFAGAVAGALLIDWLGIAGVVFLNAGSFLVSAVLNACLRLKFAKPASTDQVELSLSGWKLLGRTPVIKKVLLGFGCVNFFLTPILVVLPLYVKDVLHGSASLLGSLEAALWIGLLAGAAASKWRGLRMDTLRLGAGCLAVTGACFILPGLIARSDVFLGALFLVGLALGVNNVKFIALFQETVAPEHKGRFFAMMQAMISFTFPAAFFVFGVLVDILTPQQACLIQGLGTLALAGYFIRLSMVHRMRPRGAAHPESAAASA